MSQTAPRFGKFLVDEGIVKVEDVMQALTIQRERGESFGRICMRLGKLSVAQVFEVLNLQVDAPKEMFGELCVEMGYLSTDDVSEVLQCQQISRPPIGEILVEIGSLDSETLDEAVASFDVVQRKHTVTL